MLYGGKRGCYRISGWFSRAFFNFFLPLFFTLLRGDGVESLDGSVGLSLIFSCHCPWSRSCSFLWFFADPAPHDPAWRDGSRDGGSAVLAAWRLSFICTDVLRHRRGAARLCTVWCSVRSAALSADCEPAADPGRNEDGGLFSEKAKKMFFYIEI